ncbi:MULTISPECIES: c-type cytochrome [Thermus]|jgi:mono/diheme cytochrome c family protein|uniref:Cytochrome C-552 like protein n=1 Tax=Thermus brockianus TaxID=56956 RepID=A0A1J0LS83_THEBO|nr:MULTISPECIES: c-type cytochrome [Thermus]APD08884.1 cytochrome C-552 like protein [Thermus brockianus]
MRKTLVLLGALALGLGGYWALSQYTLPEGPGKELVLAKCQACHDIGFVARERLSRERWDAIMTEMVSRGLQVTPEERGAILDYLALYLGTQPPPAPAPVAAAPASKTGAQVYANCLGCHGPQGEGNPPIFPPLKGHTEKLLKAQGGRDYLLLAVLYGVQGTLKIEGQEYSGIMPGFAWLSDEDLALVLNHLAAWGAPQGFKAYAPEEVKAARAKPLTPEEVLKLRQGLKLP